MGELEILFGDFFGVLLPVGTRSGIESGTEVIGSATTPLGAELTNTVVFVEPKAVFTVDGTSPGEPDEVVVVTSTGIDVLEGAELEVVCEATKSKLKLVAGTVLVEILVVGTTVRTTASGTVVVTKPVEVGVGSTGAVVVVVVGMVVTGTVVSVIDVTVTVVEGTVVEGTVVTGTVVTGTVVGGTVATGTVVTGTVVTGTVVTGTVVTGTVVTGTVVTGTVVTGTVGRGSNSSVSVAGLGGVVRGRTAAGSRTVAVLLADKAPATSVMVAVTKNFATPPGGSVTSSSTSSPVPLVAAQLAPEVPLQVHEFTTTTDEPESVTGTVAVDGPSLEIVSV
jgi:hypothetical protein